MKSAVAFLVMALLLVTVGRGSTSGQTLMGWQLNESNTGLAGAGIDRDTLPLCSLAPDQYGWLRPAKGAVIREKRIENPMCLVTGNITIEKCWIKLTKDPGAGMPMITDFDFNSMKACTAANFIRDCDIDATFLPDPGGTRENFPTVGGTGIWQRNNIHGVGCGYTAGGDGVPILVEGNYIHALRTGTTSHDDGLTLRSRSAPRTDIRCNRIDCSTIHSTGALFLQATFGFLDSMYIEGNLLEGNGYNLILEWNGYGYGRIWAWNNRFHPTGYGPGYTDGGGGWLGWEEMYLNDSTQADNKGTAVSEFKPQANSALTAPSNLQAALQSPDQVHLTWTDNTGPEKGFRIERSRNGGAYIGIDMVDSNKTVFNDVGLPSGNYSYRVAAYNKPGMSAYSNTASVQVTTSIGLSAGDRKDPAAAARSMYTARELSVLSGQQEITIYTLSGAILGLSRAAGKGVFFILDASVSYMRKIVVIQ